MGAGLYLYCSESSRCSYSISESNFKSNYAYTRGAGVHYNYYAPTVDLGVTVFEDNFAPYGENISAFPYELQFENPEEIKMQVSGQLIEKPILLTVRDYYGNIITIDDSTTVSIKSMDTNRLTLSGATSVTSRGGWVTFDSVNFLGEPGATGFELMFEIQQYEARTVRTAYDLNREVVLNELTTAIDLRECVIGEEETNSKCIVCSPGKFSLFENSKSCDNCPDHAICRGGAEIDVNEGYWRASFISSNIHQCLYSPACK